MNKVWILLLGMDYEGEEILGVFDTENKALAGAREYVERRPSYKRDMKRAHGQHWLYRSAYEYLRLECCNVR